MAIREGRWRCEHCQVENLGRHKHCVGLDGKAGCGQARGRVKFYLVGNEPAVTDPRLLKQARSGPDYPQEPGATKAERVRPAEIHSTAAPVSKIIADVAATEKATPLRVFGRNPVDLHEMEREARQARNRRIKLVALAAAFSLSVLVVLWRMFFSTFSVEAKIEGFTWERSIAIERYQTVREEDWTIPSGGREVSSYWKLRRYREVLDHYESRSRQVSETVQTRTEEYSCGTRDLGNGFFEDRTCSRPVYETQYRTEYYTEPVYRNEPVYEVYYTYDIERWLHDRTERASGMDQNPTWPTFSLAGQHERVSKRSENYLVKFKTAEGKTIERDYPESEWKTMSSDQRYRIDQNRVGYIQTIERL